MAPPKQLDSYQQGSKCRRQQALRLQASLPALVAAITADRRKVPAMALPALTYSILKNPLFAGI